MNLGFIKIFLLFVVVLVIGVFAFLTLSDVPVQQTEMVVPISETISAPVPAQEAAPAAAAPEMATPAPAPAATPAPSAAPAE